MKSDGRRCGRMNPMTDLDPQENSYTEADWLYTVLQKRPPFYFLNNCVKN